MKAFVFALLLLGTALHAAKLEYNRDVRPILSDKCFKCHGPDSAARKADRRLDVRDAALAEIDGVRAIVPGKPDESELVRLVEAAAQIAPAPHEG